ncbi:MAG: hypothetical protein AAF242_04945 [Bacteroidota bacterium]
MDPIFKKLNYKDQTYIVILNAPESFREHLDAIEGLTTIHTDWKVDKIDFVLCFVTQKKEIAAFAEGLLDRLDGDALVWVAYPKKSSKKYNSDISRDDGWQPLGELELEGVRMVAIDTDWSALRFRKVAFIKNLTRRKSMTLSKAAKDKTSGK